MTCTHGLNTPHVRTRYVYSIILHVYTCIIAADNIKLGIDTTPLTWRGRSLIQTIIFVCAVCIRVYICMGIPILYNVVRIIMTPGTSGSLFRYIFFSSLESEKHVDHLPIYIYFNNNLYIHAHWHNTRRYICIYNVLLYYCLYKNCVYSSCLL